MSALDPFGNNSLDLFGNGFRASRGFGGMESNSGGTDEWLTPPDLIAALGTFDLDPCSPIGRPWPTAARHYTIADDGLRQPWEGRVWLNPPYANAGVWMHRLAEHGTGTAFLFARTETRMWHEHIWPRATALRFLLGRVRFHYRNGKPAGPAAAPSALIAYGVADAAALRAADIPGHYVDLGRAVA